MLDQTVMDVTAVYLEEERQNPALLNQKHNLVQALNLRVCLE